MKLRIAMQIYAFLLHWIVWIAPNKYIIIVWVALNKYTIAKQIIMQIMNTNTEVVETTNFTTYTVVSYVLCIYIDIRYWYNTCSQRSTMVEELSILSREMLVDTKKVLEFCFKSIGETHVI